MKKKLTSRYIETVVAPGPKRLEVYDQTLSGFGIRVSVTGRKTWFCSTRTNGRMKRTKLGTYPALSLTEARDAAKETLRDTQLGIVPEPACPTLGEIVPQFIDLYAKPRNRGWRTQERLLIHHWTPLFGEPVDQIKRQDAVRVLDNLVAGPSNGSANNAMRSALFLGVDPADPDRLALGHGKASASLLGPTIAFERYGGGRDDVPKLVPMNEINADYIEICAPKKREPGRPASQSEAARDHILKLLDKEPKPWSEIWQSLDNWNIASEATFNTVRAEMAKDGLIVQVGKGPKAKWKRVTGINNESS